MTLTTNNILKWRDFAEGGSGLRMSEADFRLATVTLLLEILDRLEALADPDPA